jgi:hypothetical protein
MSVSSVFAHAAVSAWEENEQNMKALTTSDNGSLTQTLMWSSFWKAMQALGNHYGTENNNLLALANGTTQPLEKDLQ